MTTRGREIEDSLRSLQDHLETLSMDILDMCSEAEKKTNGQVMILETNVDPVDTYYMLKSVAMHFRSACWYIDTRENDVEYLVESFDCYIKDSDLEFTPKTLQGFLESPEIISKSLLRPLMRLKPVIPTESKNKVIQGFRDFCNLAEESRRILERVRS